MDIDAYRTGWRERAEREAEVRRAAERRARERLLEVKALLYGAGAARVWLIGSLARGDFHVDSDIDLMAEGLSQEQAAALAARAADIAGMNVDILRAESLAPGWRAYHERWGELLS